MNVKQTYACDAMTLSPAFLGGLNVVISEANIPDHVKQVSVHFRASSYEASQTGPHPVEVRLERLEACWSVVFIASFSYPSPEHQALSPELYFNFKRGWFYQPDIQTCELNRPEVVSLLASWSHAFCKHLYHARFDTIGLTEVKS
ncbi:DUF2787 family protein [Vibrio owensii]|uniref:DUF2787 family protein n=1 Tax=Vibrio owensii TaxID=696485 RepID=UPI003AAD3D8D